MGTTNDEGVGREMKPTPLDVWPTDEKCERCERTGWVEHEEWPSSQGRTDVVDVFRQCRACGHGEWLWSRRSAASPPSTPDQQGL
jgi:hypothetical protein